MRWLIYFFNNNNKYLISALLSALHILFYFLYLFI